MSKQVEFFFDVGSPCAYLAFTQLPAICEKQGAELVYRPFLLGGVFKASGNAAPAQVPAKGKWLMTDLGRFAARYGEPLTFNRHFPINSLQLMRMAVAIQQQQPQRLPEFVDLAFRGIWVADQNLNDADVTANWLQEGGFDAKALSEAAQQTSVKESLKQITQEAVERGAFGAPTCFVGKEMFFGQDRLDFVEEALQQG